VTLYLAGTPGGISWHNVKTDSVLLQF